MAILKCLALCMLAGMVLSESSVDVTVDNRNSPSFYKSEGVKLECTYTVDQTLKSTFSSVGIAYRSKDGDNPQPVGCTVVRKFGGVATVSVESVAGLVSLKTPDQTQCQKAFDSLSAGNSATLEFQFPMEKEGVYTCMIADPSSLAESDTLNVDLLKVLPSSPITNEVEAGAVYYEGQEVLFDCSSEGGVPEANFTYTRDGEDMGSDPIKFTATRNDHATTLTCRDQSHSDYYDQQSSLIMSEANINVYYFTAPMTELNKTMNPTATHSLDCTVQSFLPGDSTISYSWTQNGVVLAGENEKVIEIAYDNSSDTREEQYSCTAEPNISDLKPVSIKFNIMWDDSATTVAPTVPVKPDVSDKAKPGSSEGEKKDPTVTIIVVVVVVLVVIIVVVIVIIVIKKKKQSGSADTTTKESRTPKDDVEKAGEGDGATEKENTKLLTPTQEQESSKPTES